MMNNMTNNISVSYRWLRR